MQSLHRRTQVLLLDTKAACGGDARGVMCSVNPQLSKLHAEVYAHAKEASDHAIPNQNLIIADIAPEARPDIQSVMKQFGLDLLNGGSGLRLNSMACVALPTCGLAMAESERYLPDLVGKIEKLLATHHLEDEPITIRMTGCPNGCSRPYIAEIALTGRTPSKYNLNLGGGFSGHPAAGLSRKMRDHLAEHVQNGGLADIFENYLIQPLGEFRRLRHPCRIWRLASIGRDEQWNLILYCCRNCISLVIGWHILLPAITVGLAAFIAMLEGLNFFTGGCGRHRGRHAFPVRYELEPLFRRDRQRVFSAFCL